MIIVIGGIKGGAGKSMTAANLAVRRALDNYDVLLVDGDDQGTTTLWAATRNEEYPEGGKHLTSIQLRGKAARTEVLKMAPNYSDVVVDVGGRDTTTQRAALTVADVVLLPMPPRGPDIWTLDQVAELIEEVRTVNADLRAWAFINKADSQGSDNAQAKEFIEETAGIDFIAPRLGDRKVFPNAHTHGLGVVEFKPKDKKAVKELEELYQFCFSTK